MLGILKKTALLLFVNLVLINLTQVSAQTSKSKSDSLRTLKLLKKTFDAVIEENKKSDSGALEMEIDGLVVDQTITKVGRDFYDLFFSSWEAPKNSKNYTITIKEMVLPGLATQITVMVNDNEVFKQRVQPRYEILEQMTNYASQQTKRYLNNYEKMKAQLEEDDQQGTGIF